MLEGYVNYFHYCKNKPMPAREQLDGFYISRWAIFLSFPITFTRLSKPCHRVPELSEKVSGYRSSVVLLQFATARCVIWSKEGEASGSKDSQSRILATFAPWETKSCPTPKSASLRALCYSVMIPARKKSWSLKSNSRVLVLILLCWVDGGRIWWGVSGGEKGGLVWLSYSHSAFL